MAAPAFRTLDDIQRAGSSTSEEVARLIFGDTFLVGHLEDKRETFGPLPSVIAHHREWSVTPGLGSRETSESTADKLWSSYRLTIERLDGEWTRKELRKAKAGIFTANFKAFLEATSFLGVSTSRQFRSLGLSRRTYFYWVSKVKNGRPISDQYHIDFKLWLVWKCLELATKKSQMRTLLQRGSRPRMGCFRRLAAAQSMCFSISMSGVAPGFYGSSLICPHPPRPRYSGAMSPASIRWRALSLSSVRMTRPFSTGDPPVRRRL